MVRASSARQVITLAFALLACSRSEPEAKPEPKPVSAPAPTGPLIAARGVRVVKAPANPDAAAAIREELERTKTVGRDLVVYVGAPWCEPCQRFHHAAERGELDSDFPTLTLIEFNLDVDGARLERAGYKSELIPLFVLPDGDGRASDRRFEGSIKGDRAVANIAPRLRALVARSASADER
jgi:hypothetical protein